MELTCAWESENSKEEEEGDLTELTARWFTPTRFWRAMVEFMSGVENHEEAGGEEVEDSGSHSNGTEEAKMQLYLPRFMRGFGFRRDTVPQSSCTAAFTKKDDPLLRPPEGEFEDDHLNPTFVDSVITMLKEGFWLWASMSPGDEYLLTWDNSWTTLMSDVERDFIDAQCEAEVEAGCHSPAFSPDLLPGMYSTPVIAILKAHSEDLHLVANQSAGVFCQNSMVDKAQMKGACMDSLLVFIPMIIAFTRANLGKRLVLWKSNIANTFRLLPMHPLWQIKQVITAGMLSKGQSISGDWDRSSVRQYVD
ncbi:hypothetical protein GYMLUDRAFT_55692 [Collybiopsis luxurians FD-317 M1]|nr:hypothetical protein GYMLUDRAFT_55692 [Collybiopsis luxurians FD-317 M1]